jgi:DNA-directed RNA polymerase specialized sigma24 family protein
MASAGSVTDWIGKLKAGDAGAAQQLWERYFHRLVWLARRRLGQAPRRAADEEDVALSAFDSFFRRAERGRFPQLFDRDDLWQLLVMLTARKAIRLREHERRQKRGGGQVQAETDLAAAGAASGEPALDQLAGPEPTPEFAAEVAEECRRLLDQLEDPGLRSVALWKMEGYTTEEIAEKVGCVPRSVERKVRLIRDIWSQETSP